MCVRASLSFRSLRCELCPLQTRRDLRVHFPGNTLSLSLSRFNNHSTEALLLGGFLLSCRARLLLRRHQHSSRRRTGRTVLSPATEGAPSTGRGGLLLRFPPPGRPFLSCGSCCLWYFSLMLRREATSESESDKKYKKKRKNTISISMAPWGNYFSFIK